MSDYDVSHTPPPLAIVTVKCRKPIEVTDAMVARAVRSFWGHIPDMQPRDVWPYRMRRALTAALSGE